jgi:hypothetical protein
MGVHHRLTTAPEAPAPPRGPPMTEAPAHARARSMRSSGRGAVRGPGSQAAGRSATTRTAGRRPGPPSCERTR